MFAIIVAMTVKPRPTITITAEHARFAALRAQGLHSATAPTDLPAMLRQLGAIQLDTISVLARSHELVPYARLGAIGRAAVESTYWPADATTVVEYEAHAACLLPVQVWPYFAFRRREQQARFAAAGLPRPLLREVRGRLADGPVTATDLGGAKGVNGAWSLSQAKVVAEWLYTTGEVACRRRMGWKRVYELAERAVPDELRWDATDNECYEQLVLLSLRALGVATRHDIANYLWLRKGDVDRALARLELAPIQVDGWDEPAWADPDALAGAEVDGTHRCTLLSPFDSLIWTRERMGRLFGVVVLLEAYRPKEERVHGYFAMPVLAGGAIVGRVDPAREGQTLVVRQASLEDPGRVAELATALREAASWVGCTDIRIERLEPAKVARALGRELNR